MGIRCSLLGHDYGESFVERDREERGNEVVVTERELRECARCGAENVTTENTEVRTLEPDRSADASAGQSRESEPTPSQEPAASEESTPSQEPAPEPTESTADATDDEFGSPTDAIEQAEAGTTTTTDDAETDDDAVILDADADDSDPRSEQWDEPADPDVEPGVDDAVPEPTPDPADEDVEFVESSPDGTDAGPAAQPDPEPDHQPAAGAGTAGAEAGATSQSASGTDRAPGEWPETDGEDEGFDAGPVGETEQTAEFQFGEDDDEEFVATDTGFTSAGPIDQSDSDDLDFALFCPECGFERYAAGSSLRAGDICPECQRGYLAEER